MHTSSGVGIKYAAKAVLAAIAVLFVFYLGLEFIPGFTPSALFLIGVGIHAFLALVFGIGCWLFGLGAVDLLTEREIAGGLFSAFASVSFGAGALYALADLVQLIAVTFAL